MAGFLPTVPFYCIHLQRIHERLPLIQTLEEKIKRPITRFEASDGKEVATYGWPKRHPFSSSEITNGILGCLDSHIRLLVNMIQSNYDMIGIFEDDAEVLVTSNELVEFYKKVPADWDILILGANEWVEYKKEELYVKPVRYWGTHAFLIKKEAAKKVIETHIKVLKDGITYPADWLYSEAIKRHTLNVYGPEGCASLIQQKPGLMSEINGKVRS